MKQLILFVLILGVSISCRKAVQDAVPADPLYQKWKLVEIQNSRGLWEPVTDETTIEFRADGSIHYQKPEPACCAPTGFERQSQTLKITETYGGGDCIYVDCASPAALTILSLTPAELIIEPVYGTTSPVSYSRVKYKSLK